MNNEDIVNYVTNTPHNSNPQVLRTMLNQLNSGSDSSNVLILMFTGNNGYLGDSSVITCDKSNEEILEALKNNSIIIAKYYARSYFNSPGDNDFDYYYDPLTNASYNNDDIDTLYLEFQRTTLTYGDLSGTYLVINGNNISFDVESHTLSD